MTSIKKREMIMQARADGMKIKEIVEVYHVGCSTVYDLFNLVEETGDIQPRPHEYGRKPCLNEEKMGELRTLLDEQCDITLAERNHLFESRLSMFVKFKKFLQNAMQGATKTGGETS